MTSYPEPSFQQLLRLSDDTGLLEHARGASPRRGHGYCVDDVARGLVVIAREPTPGPELLGLAERYLAFTAHAQAPDGAFHNRFGYDRRWLDVPDTGDWWGRALWGLGTIAARSPVSWMRAEARVCFEAGVHLRSPWPRAMAFAALGAAELLTLDPDHAPARDLLAHAAAAIGPVGDNPAWPWPEPRLEYGNAVLPEVLIAAGHHLGRDDTTKAGLTLLSWLLEVETSDGRLSPTAVGGWGPTEPRQVFDQQPIEVAALADACARAFRVTGEPHWAAGLRLSIDWFLGANDADASLLAPDTGGGYDGLTPTGPNANQGAESTLALIATLQHARSF